MNTNTIRWGIIATGNIANKFATGLKELPDAELVGVASRSLDKARQFAKEFAVPKAYGSYEELAQDSDIDAIYIGTPHPYHLANVLLCLEHGKAILCEKPLAVNSKEANLMIEKAREKQLFLMEALWTRHLPVWVQIRKWLDQGLIGEIRLLTADFSFLSNTNDPQHRRYNPELAGGALLDIGIYPLALAYDIFKEEPEEVQSTFHPFHTGVDESSAYLLRYANGAIASLTSSFAGQGSMEAVITGTKGTIRVPFFWKAQSASVQLSGEDVQHHSFPYPATGLQCQASTMMECLRAGKLESELMPHSESLRLIGRMDSLRQSWGLTYPYD
ncbi:MAG: Gfo/Idh/MocA family oxidoreductase [Bacteroidota bacterium]